MNLGGARLFRARCSHSSTEKAERGGGGGVSMCAGQRAACAVVLEASSPRPSVQRTNGGQ